MGIASLALACSTQSQQGNQRTQAEESYQNAPSPSLGTGSTAPQGPTEQDQGVVKQVDRERGTFTLVSGYSNKIFQVTSATDIFKNDSAASLDDVFAGDRVTAVCAAPAPGAQTVTVEHLRAWSSIRGPPLRH